jgi:hypothetical protein
MSYLEALWNFRSIRYHAFNISAPANDRNWVVSGLSAFIFGCTRADMRKNPLATGTHSTLPTQTLHYLPSGCNGLSSR